MSVYKFCVIEVQKSDSSEFLSEDSAYEAIIDAQSEDAARKIGIEKFMDEFPEANIDNFVTDISVA